MLMLLVALGIPAVTVLAADSLSAKTDHWAFQAPLQSKVPTIHNERAVFNPIDYFIAAELEKHGLKFSAPADRLTLIRRLSLDLRGLPPTPDEIDQFLRDTREEAYPELVDRMLASPRYGERWARHWLDVVHFGESHGYDKDKPRKNAWPYRDYVIRAFNKDKPYSRFVEEQLAGDVLFPDDPQGVVATGFIAAGPWDFVGHVELPESKTDGLIARYNDRDDMVMTAMSTFQSLTVHCARCHDHKFDPISQRDYYGLQAVFAGVDRADRWFDSDPEIFAKRKQLLTEKKVLESQRRILDEQPSKITSPQIQELDEHLRSATNELNRLPQPQHVYAAANEFAPSGSFVPPGKPRPVHLLQRGDVKHPGELMQPAALSCVPGLNSQLAVTDPGIEGNRRAALAKWLTAPANFLTRCSIVNRVWQNHFGRGIVDTPNDFGHMGSLPTHPELLDWLASWFMENGESFKKLHRLIVTSATYRQSSQSNPAFETIDAENRYLWRMNRTRLDAESFHDALLQISGQLDLTMGGPSVEQFFFKDDHSPVYDYTRYNFDGQGSQRRSVYRFIVRSVPDPFMDCLDSADPSLLIAKRNTTITALQALATLNNPFVIRQCEHFATRLQKLAPDQEAQIQQGYQFALGRSPQADELKRLVDYAAKHGLANACRVLLNTNEFMFVD